MSEVREAWLQSRFSRFISFESLDTDTYINSAKEPISMVLIIHISNGI